MRSRLPTVALGSAVVAVVPYITLKLMWLGGSTIGLKTDAGVSEIHGTRMVVGNEVTIVLEVLAVGLAAALTRPWGMRVPAWVIVVLGGGATGLLAPILLGMPLGSMLQLLVSGDLHTSGMDEMRPWVFAVVYGGFGVLAVAIAVLAGRYVVQRWGRLLRRPPRPPAVWAITVGALGLLPFAAIMIWWGVLGPGGSGPQGMEAPVQRTVLVVTGLLALGGFLTPLVGRAFARQPRLAWLIAWCGCTTVALQGPTEVLLANGGDPTPAVTLIAFVTAPGSCVYGLAVLRGRISQRCAGRDPLRN